MILHIRNKIHRHRRGIEAYMELIICSLSKKWKLLHKDISRIKLYEPRREKTGFLHMRKQRRRSASR